MNKSVKYWSIGVVLILAIVAIIYLKLNNSTSTFNTSPITGVSSPTPTVLPVTPTSTSKYTSEFRAIARARFIESCKAKVGQQYTTACNCGADYLAAHYTDTELEKAYIAYHSGNKVPKEIQAAYDACKE